MFSGGGEFRIASMRSKISSFEAAGRRSRARRRPIKSHTRRRRIDEADISTPASVDQHAANCFKEAVRLFTPCGAGADRHALTSPSVVHCQFFKLCGARLSTASKLA
ncbi:hypothetical protein TNCV_4906361 [Trichonephila clavipes]|uniref:Uncharacterized protein n=1 Tax=Trichonephila clavipes TaxID=2585209 RepID=A0A8X6RP34_TRICX|nr:hypothetical protein TNCV_4906361 [Trichonephila clavipes]